ncbi:hypothetical protein IF1G_00661 [Cordyceps javanica]|uniref:Uncharacterized protein n=1 Tax=Cordyceps javanica TaxID=43265 RepID=A0A545WD60_9HYPO|nr:hypothetical protein IF1G_00661 [Cordyceps javanica]TQW11910.1 hypothetical protein IF2G_00641 [Cordyceps javanica]
MHATLRGHRSETKFLATHGRAFHRYGPRSRSLTSFCTIRCFGVFYNSKGKRFSPPSLSNDSCPPPPPTTPPLPNPKARHERADRKRISRLSGSGDGGGGQRQLFQLVRGSGMAFLAAIAEKKFIPKRPLLVCVGRAEHSRTPKTRLLSLWRF